jgi:hypothetical protein
VFVCVHQELDGPLPDLEGRHVRQKVVSHEEAHEYCNPRSQALQLGKARGYVLFEWICSTMLKKSRLKKAHTIGKLAEHGCRELTAEWRGWREGVTRTLGRV